MAGCSGDQKCMLTERFKQGSVIKFCANSGMTPTKAWKFFSDNSRGKKISRTIGFDWYKPFWVDRVGISDDFRSEKPRISDNAKNVQDAISIDKQGSIHDIGDIAGLSLVSVQWQDSV